MYLGALILTLRQAWALLRKIHFFFFPFPSPPSLFPFSSLSQSPNNTKFACNSRFATLCINCLFCLFLIAWHLLNMVSKNVFSQIKNKLRTNPAIQPQNVSPIKFSKKIRRFQEHSSLKKVSDLRA